MVWMLWFSSDGVTWEIEDNFRFGSTQEVDTGKCSPMIIPGPHLLHPICMSSEAPQCPLAMTDWAFWNNESKKKKPFSLKLFLSGIYSQKQERTTRPVSLYIFFEGFVHVYSVFGSYIPLTYSLSLHLLLDPSPLHPPFAFRIFLFFFFKPIESS